MRPQPGAPPSSLCRPRGEPCSRAERCAREGATRSWRGELQAPPAPPSPPPLSAAFALSRNCSAPLKAYTTTLPAPRAQSPLNLTALRPPSPRAGLPRPGMAPDRGRRLWGTLYAAVVVLAGCAAGAAAARALEMSPTALAPAQPPPPYGLPACTFTPSPADAANSTLDARFCAPRGPPLRPKGAAGFERLMVSGTSTPVPSGVVHNSFVWTDGSNASLAAPSSAQGACAAAGAGCLNSAGAAPLACDACACE